jgi:hypothetical protein
MVGILDVHLDGIPEDAKAEFEKALEDQLDTSTYWLSSRAQMRDRLKFSTKWTEGCVAGSCLAEVKTQTGAELVLLVALSGAGTSFGYVVTLMRTDNGKPLDQEAGRCDVCTAREAMNDATLATLNLLNDVPDKLPDEALERKAAIDLAVGRMVRRVEASERAPRRRAIVVTVVGLALTAVGAAIYFAAEKPDYALAIGGAGGGVTLTGVALLTF